VAVLDVTDSWSLANLARDPYEPQSGKSPSRAVELSRPRQFRANIFYAVQVAFQWFIPRPLQFRNSPGIFVDALPKKTA